MARPKHRTRPGGTYFITAETAQRHRIFQNHEAARICEDKLIEYRDRGFYLLHRYTMMPDHLHAILTPAETTTLERAVQLVKGGSSHEVNKALLRKFPMWQAGFTEHLIRDQATTTCTFTISTKTRSERAWWPGLSNILSALPVASIGWIPGHRLQGLKPTKNRPRYRRG